VTAAALADPRPVAAAADRPGFLGLHDLAGFLADGESLDDWLAEAARGIAAALSARCCSVMLLSGDDTGAPLLVVAAASAALPASAWTAPRALGEGIAGMVARSGAALLLSEVARIGNDARPHGRPDAGRGAICVPIALRGRVLGVLNVCGPEGSGVFDGGDLARAEAFAGLLARTVQAAQLQRILDQRFAQIALAESGRRHAGIMQKAMPPDRAAQIVARSLFRQMTCAGFSDKQIIRTASEILDELNRRLRQATARKRPAP
jgi:signal transduction protein with GAF and PtsI domain